MKIRIDNNKVSPKKGTHPAILTDNIFPRITQRYQHNQLFIVIPISNDFSLSVYSYLNKVKSFFSFISVHFIRLPNSSVNAWGCPKEIGETKRRQRSGARTRLNVRLYHNRFFAPSFRGQSVLIFQGH